MDRINKAKLDPLPMYEKIDIILTREEKPVPEKEDEETDEHYRQRLIEVWHGTNIHTCIYVQYSGLSITVCLSPRSM